MKDVLRLFATGVDLSDLEDLPASTLALPKLLTVRDRSSMESAVTVMVESGIKALPVICEGGTLVGIVSLSDLARVLAQEIRAGSMAAAA